MILLIFHLSFTTIGVLFDAGMLQKQELATRKKNGEESASEASQLSNSNATSRKVRARVMNYEKIVIIHCY